MDKEAYLNECFNEGLIDELEKQAKAGKGVAKKVLDHLKSVGSKASKVMKKEKDAVTKSGKKIKSVITGKKKGLIFDKKLSKKQRKKLLGKAIKDLKGAPMAGAAATVTGLSSLAAA